MAESEGGAPGTEALGQSSTTEQSPGPLTDCRSAGPAPEPSVDSAGWWEGLRAHRTVLQRCTTCGRTRFPPMPSCPWCASTGVELTASPCLGTVYSYVTVHVSSSPGREAMLPYTVATVELDEGPRMVGRVQPTGAVGIGDRVRPRFVDHAGWTELCFDVVTAGGPPGIPA